MKVTNIDLWSSRPALLANVSFRDPASRNPYLVKAIVGLDVEQLTAKYYGTSADESEKYYHMTLKRRELVIRVVLNPAWSTTETVESLRDKLYQGIASSRTGSMTARFKNGETVLAEIKGFVTKFEVAHFANVPEIQITLDCPDPMFRSPDYISVTPPAALSPNLIITDNISTAPHGFKAVGLFSGPTNAFTMWDSEFDWAFTVEPGNRDYIDGFQNLDQLHFSSETGNKYLYMMRDGATIHLIDKLAPNSIWPMLFPGANNFLITPAYFAWTSISYKHAYWGV